MHPDYQSYGDGERLMKRGESERALYFVAAGALAVDTGSDRGGALGTMVRERAGAVIGEAGGNIMNLRMHHRQSGYFDVDFDLDVRDARHLTHVAAGLRACPEVDVVDRAQD